MSYIFNCNNIDKLNVKSIDEWNSNITKTYVIKFINDSHKNSNFTISFNYNKLNKTNTINNKLILREGNYYCSYLYFDEITQKIYYSKLFASKPLLPPTNKLFSNIVINHDIIFNKNIIGVIYYYQEFNKNNIYIIDYLYYNTLVNSKTTYKLNYIHYHSILKNKINEFILDYIYFTYKNKDEINNFMLLKQNVDLILSKRSNIYNDIIINKNKLNLVY